jgi:hypothetical protein
VAQFSKLIGCVSLSGRSRTTTKPNRDIAA